MSTSTHAIDTHVDGLRRGELLISFCSHCEAVRFPPGGVCPSCHEASTPQWRAVAARGKVWSFAVFHKGYDPSFRLPTPYVVAIVELDCGALLYTNMPTTHPEDLAIGAPVTGRFELDSAANTHLLQFYRDHHGESLTS